MLIHFKADVFPVASIFHTKSTLQELAAEPCLFSCDWKTAKDAGGALTKKVIKELEYRQYPSSGAVIDVRVQRLMPGMYPSIPGWHCDAVPRDGYYSQPDFTKANQDIRHLVLVQSTEDDGVSRTQYTMDEFNVNLDAQHGFIYKQLHDYIENSHHAPITKWQCNQGLLYGFSHFQPHRTMPCTTRGWRMFFRLSYYHNPPIVNKIESVQQVYLLSEANGW